MEHETALQAAFDEFRRLLSDNPDMPAHEAVRIAFGWE